MTGDLLGVLNALCGKFKSDEEYKDVSFCCFQKISSDLINRSRKFNFKFVSFFANKQVSPSAAKEIYSMAKKIKSNAKWFTLNKNKLSEWTGFLNF